MKSLKMIHIKNLYKKKKEPQTHTPAYKIGNHQGPPVEHRELYSILCNKQYGKAI